MGIMKAGEWDSQRIQVGPTGIVTVDEFEVCNCNDKDCPEAGLVFMQILAEETLRG